MAVQDRELKPANMPGFSVSAADAAVAGLKLPVWLICQAHVVMVMAEGSGPWALVSHRGCIVANPAGPAAVFLRSNPQGAYTTTRTGDDGAQVLVWERHMRRLAQSMEVLATAMPDRFSDPPSSFDCLLELVEPSLKVGLHTALKMKRPGEEVNVTVLALAGHDSYMNPPGKWDMSIHLSNYIPKSPLTPAHLAIMGPSRDLPLAKYSLWATTRHMLENSKPIGVSEIILSNDGNRLLEGLVTNFFVVSRNSEATDPNIPEKWRDIEVQTAALADGVLPGVIRQLVIEVCGDNGIPFREMAPSWESRGTWQEAFVTSGLRILQPVGSIQRPNSEQWNIDSEIMKTCEFTTFHFKNLNHVTEYIRKFVLQRIGDENIPVQRFLSQTCTG